MGPLRGSSLDPSYGLTVASEDGTSANGNVSGAGPSLCLRSDICIGLPKHTEVRWAQGVPCTQSGGTPKNKAIEGWEVSCRVILMALEFCEICRKVSSGHESKFRQQHSQPVVGNTYLQDQSLRQ